MYSESDLEAAVAAGAISPDAATRLRTYVAQSRLTPMVDEEHFRLLTGFNDIFVSIAAIILLVAVGWIGNSIPPRIDVDGPSPFGGLFVAAAAWGLATYFTGKRRMALPSILLMLAFVMGVFGTALFTLIVSIGEARFENNDRLVSLVAAGAAAVAAGGAWVHWRKFRVPITVAAGMTALVGLILSLIAYAMGDTPSLQNTLLAFALLLGVGVFLLAMWWDGSDPRRETRRSDVAFWLHLLAAPLIVHPIFSLLGLNDGHATAGEAVIVLGVYIAFGLTALAIDRRALLVSALAYVLWALTDLFERFGAVELSFAFTALIIGSALLLLSAFWQTARGSVVRGLPGSLQSRLPVLERISPLPAS